MATDICTKRLTKELRNLMKHPMTDPKITVAAQDSNICEVHYVIEVPFDDTEAEANKKEEAKNQFVSKVPQGGVNDATTRKKSTASSTTITSPYAGGIYHGVLLFPKEYPLRPPGVKLLTKNGRFHINRRLCLSMSDFHPESWNPMWSIGYVLCSCMNVVYLLCGWCVFEWCAREASGRRGCLWFSFLPLLIVVIYSLLIYLSY